MVAQDIRSPWTISLTPVWLTIGVVFFVISIQLGRGVWGFSKVRATLLGRTVLIALNIFAVCIAPAQIARAEFAVAASLAFQFNPNEDGLRFEGDPVCDITAYDAAGEQLRGVQLFGQEGQPISAYCDGQPSTGTSLSLLQCGQCRWPSVCLLSRRRLPSQPMHQPMSSRRFGDLAGR